LRTNSWFLLRDNVAAHRSFLVKDFLGKNNVTTLKHPPYSPELAPADFYLLLRLISASKGRRFSDAKDMIKNVTEELKRLLQKGFQEYFNIFIVTEEVCSCTKGLF